MVCAYHHFAEEHFKPTERHPFVDRLALAVDTAGTYLARCLSLCALPAKSRVRLPQL